MTSQYDPLADLDRSRGGYSRNWHPEFNLAIELTVRIPDGIGAGIRQHITATDETFPDGQGEAVLGRLDRLLRHIDKELAGIAEAVPRLAQHRTLVRNTVIAKAEARHREKTRRDTIRETHRAHNERIDKAYARASSLGLLLENVGQSAVPDPKRTVTKAMPDDWQPHFGGIPESFRQQTVDEEPLPLDVKRERWALYVGDRNHPWLPPEVGPKAAKVFSRHLNGHVVYVLADAEGDLAFIESWLTAAEKENNQDA